MIAKRQNCGPLGETPCINTYRHDNTRICIF